MDWLNRKKKSLIYFLFFLLLVLVFYYFNSQRYLPDIRYISKILFWMAVPAFIFSLISVFLREEVTRSWRKFTNYFLPISIVVILLTPNSSHGMDILPLIKENVTILLVSVYSIVSLVLILYKSFKKY